MGAKRAVTPDDVQRKRDVLNYYLRLRNLDIKTLAERCGYAQQTVYNMLSEGKISAEAAERFARVLMCAPEEILTGRLSKESLRLLEAEKERQDLDIVSDERLWMRTMLLSQQRTIENLSFLAKKKITDVD